MERAPQWRSGDAVQARWDAKRGGTKWYDGEVVRVHDIKDGAGAMARVYDVQYVDNDHEQGVLARNVRARR